MHIVQIAPEICPGTDVGGVVAEREREFGRLGCETSRFTVVEGHDGWILDWGSGRERYVMNIAKIVWFSTVGTFLARRRLDRSLGAVSICQNDALTGDVYVNQGLLPVAMRARGQAPWRMFRNPGAAAREELGLPVAAEVALFVGHEHGRKGLHPLTSDLNGRVCEASLAIRSEAITDLLNGDRSGVRHAAGGTVLDRSWSVAARWYADLMSRIAGDYS